MLHYANKPGSLLTRPRIRIRAVAALAVSTISFTGCATMGMRANVKTPSATPTAAVAGGTILMADPIGKANDHSEAHTLAAAAAVAQYGTSLVPMDVVHHAASAAHVPALDSFAALLLARYQAAFAALSQKERQAREAALAAAQAKMSGAPEQAVAKVTPAAPKMSFPGYLEVPGLRNDLANAVADGQSSLASGLSNLSSMVADLAPFAAQLAEARSLVAAQDWQGFAAWRDKAPEAALAMDKATTEFFRKTGVSRILLVEVTGSEADYLAGLPVYLSYSMIETGKASITYFASMEVRKPLVPIPYAMQMTRAAYNLVETAKHAVEAPANPADALVVK